MAIAGHEACTFTSARNASYGSSTSSDETERKTAPYEATYYPPDKPTIAPREPNNAKAFLRAGIGAAASRMAGVLLYSIALS